MPFASARWGSLASFAARAYPGTRRWYGTSGNSFVAVVEFGPRVRAWAVTAGGESGDPASPHFNDQAERYASGNLRPVYFYREDLQGHAARNLSSRLEIVAEGVDDVRLILAAPAQPDLPFLRAVERDEQRQAVMIGHEVVAEIGPVSPRPGEGRRHSR